MFKRRSFTRIGGNSLDVMILYCGGLGSLGLLQALTFLTEVVCFSLLEEAFLDFTIANPVLTEITHTELVSPSYEISDTRKCVVSVM